MKFEGLERHSAVRALEEKLPNGNVFAAREVCHTALVVILKCDSTMSITLARRLDSVADSLLEFLDANAESIDVGGVGDSL